MKTIDIYDSSIDTEAQEALKKIDYMRKMIGIVPPLKSPLCTHEAEKEEYSRINFENVGRISALESMLASVKKELAEANETISRLINKINSLETKNSKLRIKGE